MTDKPDYAAILVWVRLQKQIVEWVQSRPKSATDEHVEAFASILRSLAAGTHVVVPVSELSELRAWTEWRDIAEAPRDGTYIDLWGSYGHGPSFRICGYAWRAGRWVNEDGEDASDYPKYIFQPTHFRLPPPPPGETR